MNSAPTKQATPKSKLPRLEKRLILNRFMCRLFGKDSLSKFEGLPDQQPGLSPKDGRTNFYHYLQGMGGSIRVDILARYDESIRGYAEQINKGRVGQEIKLLYFQYMAVLFTEIYLERMGRPDDFLKELNDFVESSNDTLRGGPAVAPYETFEQNDLDKLAFWMATGSGKTLIMHINILQYFAYASRGKGRVSVNNILLITPNEDLSRQHMAELRKSGFEPQAYSGNGAGKGGQLGLGGINDKTVTIIEITKLTSKKTGKGVSVDVDAFGHNNMVLVDEGHKGSKGEAWRALRDKAAVGGFTFEYSATFGQVVNGQSNQQRRLALLREYSHAIILDYSYRYFHRDGYGKDYRVLNTEATTPEYTEWLMVGGLLAFYEQCLVYAQDSTGMADYNIEKPLWLFVGSSVTGGERRKEDREMLTDMERVVEFMGRFLKEGERYKERLARLLADATGVQDSNGEEPFRNHFRYLRRQYQGAHRGYGEVVKLTAADRDALYGDIVRRVFLGKPGEQLRAAELKKASGEIGLRTGVDNPYFGVINVGDAATLLQMLTDNGVGQQEEYVGGSLFARLGEAASQVNVLIGSRKFIEGWDNYRVSSMGLMNIGKDEGSQIIQLFGRGVRLRGWDNSLKRSSRLALTVTGGGASLSPGLRSKPAWLELLETLNVVGVQASYMQAFLQSLRDECIETDLETVDVPIRETDPAFLGRNLLIIGRKDDTPFVESDEVVIISDTPDASVSKKPIEIDTRVSFGSVASDKGASAASKSKSAGASEDKASKLREIALLLDWDSIYFHLLEWKRSKGYANLVFTKQALTALLDKLNYTIYCPEGYLPPSCFADMRKAEDLAESVLTRYIDAVYTAQRRVWQNRGLSLLPIDERHPDLAVNGASLHTDAHYVVTVPHTIAMRIRQLVKAGNDLYEKDLKQPDPQTIRFDRHLYQPLFIEGSRTDMEQSNPPLLNEGEGKFVQHMRDYLEAVKKKGQGKGQEKKREQIAPDGEDRARLLEHHEVFLLRNLSRVGVGFYSSKTGKGFYPDFVLWVLGDVNGQRHQWITFVDPHGLRHAEGGFSDPKVSLYKDMQALEAKLQPKDGSCVVHLDSFVIHPMPGTYDQIQPSFGDGQADKPTFQKNHVLFQKDAVYQQDYDYVKLMFDMILARKSVSNPDASPPSHGMDATALEEPRPRSIRGKVDA